MRFLWPITAISLAVCAVVARGQATGPVVGPAPPMPAPVRVTNPTGVKVETVAAGLQIPWGLAFANGGRILVTERPGRVRLIQNGKLQVNPYLLIAATALGEGGLMGIALHPSFPSSPYVYVMYTAVVGQQRFNRVVRYTDRGTFADSPRVVLDRIPAGLYHDGGALAFGPDGNLYVGTGDAQQPELAQNLQSLAGKILRVTAEGGIPADNPFPGSAVYAYGLRNVQGLAWQPGTGLLWATTHGPTGEYGLSAMDAVFVIQRGGNHGWPRSWGVTGQPGIVPPVLFYPGTSIPPAAALFYTGNLLPELKNNFLFASLGGQHVQRVILGTNNAPTRIERWWEQASKSGVYGRLRALAQGPDGAIYFTTSNRDGRGSVRTGDDKILRVVPTGGTPPPSGTKLPDLMPQKATDIRIGVQNDLRFSTLIANMGPGVIELQGPGEDDPNHQPQPARQNLYGSGTQPVEQIPVGNFVWHGVHSHWHFEPELALYQLRTLDSTGGWQNGKVLGVGGKATFCFLDTRRVLPSVPGSPLQPRYRTCSTGIQGIAVGWMDIYSYTLDGQSIPLTTVPDGTYWIVLSIDPKRALREARIDNNVSAQKVRIGRVGTRRTVTVLLR